MPTSSNGRTKCGCTFLGLFWVTDDLCESCAKDPEAIVIDCVQFGRRWYKDGIRMHRYLDDGRTTPIMAYPPLMMHHLRLSIRGTKELESRPSEHTLLLIIDNSGSMRRYLPMVQQTMHMLVPDVPGRVVIVASSDATKQLADVLVEDDRVDYIARDERVELHGAIDRITCRGGAIRYRDAADFVSGREGGTNYIDTSARVSVVFLTNGVNGGPWTPGETFESRLGLRKGTDRLFPCGIGRCAARSLGTFTDPDTPTFDGTTDAGMVSMCDSIREHIGLHKTTILVPERHRDHIWLSELPTYVASDPARNHVWVSDQGRNIDLVWEHGPVGPDHPGPGSLNLVIEGRNVSLLPPDPGSEWLYASEGRNFLRMCAGQFVQELRAYVDGTLPAGSDSAAIRDVQMSFYLGLDDFIHEYSLRGSDNYSEVEQALFAVRPGQRRSWAVETGSRAPPGVYRKRKRAHKPTTNTA